MSLDQNTLRDDNDGVYCSARCANRNQVKCKCRVRLRFNKPFEALDSDCQFQKENWTLLETKDEHTVIHSTGKTFFEKGLDKLTCCNYSLIGLLQSRVRHNFSQVKLGPVNN